MIGDLLSGFVHRLAQRGAFVSWGWIFGEDFQSFHWRYARHAIGDWTVRMIPR